MGVRGKSLPRSPMTPIRTLSTQDDNATTLHFSRKHHHFACFCSYLHWLQNLSLQRMVKYLSAIIFSMDNDYNNFNMIFRKCWEICHVLDMDWSHTRASGTHSLLLLCQKRCQALHHEDVSTREDNQSCSLITLFVYIRFKI